MSYGFNPMSVRELDEGIDLSPFFAYPNGYTIFLVSLTVLGFRMLSGPLPTTSMPNSPDAA
ncbi:hypothetical protein BH10PLA2_BH10PLA2_31200 [soil metagenome]